MGDDPRQVYQWAREAMDRGWSLAQVNQRLAESDLGFKSFQELQTAAFRTQATAAQDASARPGPSGPGQDAFAGMGRVGRIAGDVFTLGGLDEGAGLLRGLAEGAAALVPGGRSPGEAFREGQRAETEASRERLRQAHEEAGPGTEAVGFGLGILGPGGVVRGATRTAKAARTGIPLLRGVLTGGAEGAAAGALSEDPDPDLPLAENLKQRGKAAGTPAAIGGATGGILGPVFAGRAASKAKPTAGKRLGDAARQESGLSGRASTVTDDVARRKRKISREQFAELEELGEIDHPAVRKALRADDVKPVADDLLPEEVLQGDRAPTFKEAQRVKQRLEGLRDRAFRSGDSFDVDRYQRAAGEVVDALEEAIPDRFPQAQAAWARESARLRALDEGRSLWSKTADDVESAFRDLPEDEGVRDAFREGLATEFTAWLEKLSEPKAALRRIRNSPQLRGKARILFGSDDALERFTKEAIGEQRIRDRGQLYERVLRWAGLIGAASAGGNEARSLAGGILGN